jgi:hypothetical protein
LERVVEHGVRADSGRIGGVRGRGDDIGRILGLRENTVVEDVPVLLRLEAGGKAGSERLAKDGEAESEGDAVRVEVGIGDLFVQAR